VTCHFLLLLHMPSHVCALFVHLLPACTSAILTMPLLSISFSPPPFFCTFLTVYSWLALCAIALWTWEDLIHTHSWRALGMGRPMPLMQYMLAARHYHPSMPFLSALAHVRQQDILDSICFPHMSPHCVRSFLCWRPGRASLLPIGSVPWFCAGLLDSGFHLPHSPMPLVPGLSVCLGSFPLLCTFSSSCIPLHIHSYFWLQCCQCGCGVCLAFCFCLHPRSVAVIVCMVRTFSMLYSLSYYAYSFWISARLLSWAFSISPGLCYLLC